MPISQRSVSFATLRQHRWFRPAARALAGLIALWLVTWLAIPPLAKGPLERIASEQLGRAARAQALAAHGRDLMWQRYRALTLAEGAA